MSIDSFSRQIPDYMLESLKHTHSGQYLTTETQRHREILFFVLTATPSRWRAFEQACSQFLPAAPTLWRVVEHTHVLCHNPDPIPVTTARNPPKPHFGQSGHHVCMGFRDRIQAVAILSFHFPFSIICPTPTLWILLEHNVFHFSCFQLSTPASRASPILDILDTALQNQHEDAKTQRNHFLRFKHHTPTLWSIVEHTHVLCHNHDPIPVTTARNPPKPHFGSSRHNMVSCV